MNDITFVLRLDCLACEVPLRSLNIGRPIETEITAVAECPVCAKQYSMHAQVRPHGLTKVAERQRRSRARRAVAA